MSIQYAAENHFNTRIKIIGVGGSGGNAINAMINKDIEGVEYIVANTDTQALNISLSENRVQLGGRIANGLGAGANPTVGKDAAIESMHDIEEQIENANMLFIAAGMGGGTGTGAAPVIAKKARERGILTLGIVTFPFSWEGANRARNAMDGLTELEENVDTLIVIPNDKISEVYGRLSVRDAFLKCDEVLANAAKAVSDIINKSGYINVDFADIKTIMSYPGYALMGSGEASGEGRALKAAQLASSNPLLSHVNLDKCKGILINVTGGDDLMMDEYEAINTSIIGAAGDNENVITGITFNPEMKDNLIVTIIATGIDFNDISSLSKSLQLKKPATINNTTRNTPSSTTEQVNPPSFMQQNTPVNPTPVLRIGGTQPDIQHKPNIQFHQPDINPTQNNSNVIDYTKTTSTIQKSNNEIPERPSFLKKIFD
ncbi:MAG TPA: cell division protein FtsZ [Candidatus Cloacimonadota bacterium]|nr:cell division protein FtsZ [Candidatus Cloacimonadota bacterium]